jgi:type I restriction enzyme, S subunit
MREIADCRLGKMLDKNKNRGRLRPYLRNVNVQWGRIDRSDIKEMRIADDERERYAVRDGDLLMCEGGEPGRCAVWRGDTEIYFQKALHRIRPFGDLDADYLAYYMRFAAQSGLLVPFLTGTTIKHLPGAKLVDVPVAIPPRASQRVVVAKVSRALERIQAALAHVEKGVEQIQDLRASVRQAAGHGTLGRADGGRVRLRRDARERPAGWSWRRLDDLAADEPRALTDGPFGSNLKTSHYTPSGPRVIRLQNIGDGFFIDAPAHISEDRFARLRAYEAKAGDVVIAILGETLPRACVVPRSLGPAIVKADCPRLRPAPDVEPEYLSLVLNSRLVRDQAARIIHGVGRPRLNLRELRALSIPVPSRREQQRIVTAAERQLGAADQFRAELAETRIRVQGLERAVLAAATGGRAL